MLEHHSFLQSKISGGYIGLKEDIIWFVPWLSQFDQSDSQIEVGFIIRPDQ